MDALLLATIATGYLLIALEHWTKVNKAAVSLIAGVLCWTIYVLGADSRPEVVKQLAEHLGGMSGILFFVLGAMTVVELIDAHAGFRVITRHIRQTNKRQLLWIVSLLAFFMAAVLGNITATIVCISLLRKLIDDLEDRRLYAGMVVIAVNAGGAWTAIGDVTTVMLWIGGQVTTLKIMMNIGLPSLVCVTVAALLVMPRLKGAAVRPEAESVAVETPLSRRHQIVVLVTGLGALVMVPVFKAVTHLPPYMGMMIGLGVLWVVTEIMHRGKTEEDRQTFSVAGALRRIDTSVVLFFFGILLCVASLDAVGQLDRLGHWLNIHLAGDRLSAVALGLLSAVVDNVPLVAAAQGMYSLTQYPTDHEFWGLMAYCVGTGGSVLIIGSAAGVAAMGMERLDFWWYMRRMGWIALVAYLAGVAFFVFQSRFLW